ncbi:Cytolethal distending toxin subunit B precursor [Streptomyces sp. YIM 121038]|uniref:FG-GAP-like repeat-containing protein n=1 Tax=Streptomyces sp. YIM 121038 TaxID=2136401 RepID=UPI0011652A18|nr:FG-GAP-like repeat-containing protein [Streptomyces sp. YIM 121038]QCX74663.1 Cytolethal distending toxin subunit B precursor [Streptomyces sp. YIM 121038]
MARISAMVTLTLALVATLLSAAGIQPAQAQITLTGNDERVISWNMQGGNKWTYARQNLLPEGDVVALQEAQKPPSDYVSPDEQRNLSYTSDTSANGRTAKGLPSLKYQVFHKQWGRPTARDRNLGHLYYLKILDKKDWGSDGDQQDPNDEPDPTTGDEPDRPTTGRSNAGKSMAIWTKEAPDEVRVVRVTGDDRKWIRQRPALGVRFGHTWYFSVHAASIRTDDKPNPHARALVDAIRDAVGGAHWRIVGDFNSGPSTFGVPHTYYVTDNGKPDGPPAITQQAGAGGGYALDFLVADDALANLSVSRGNRDTSDHFPIRSAPADRPSCKSGSWDKSTLYGAPGRAARAAADEDACGVDTIVSMGDSFISGEGGRWAGNADPTSRTAGSAWGTDRAAIKCNDDDTRCEHDLTTVYGDTSYQGGNGCDRSDVAEIRGGDIYGIPPERRINIACSGAETKHVRSVGLKGEEPQVQQLRALAGSHDIKVIALSIGGNDLDFSGVLKRCARRFMFNQGACHGGEEGPLKEKLAGLKGSVEGTVDAIRSAMRAAGREDGDYTLVIQSYPSPLPRAEDMRETGDTYARYSKAGFPFYDEDATWTNRTVVPKIADALKGAAIEKKAVFLDLGRALSGHELNSKHAKLADENNSRQSPLSANVAEWVRWVDHLPDLPNLPGSRKPQGEVQEFVHPNAFGQQALSECLSQTVRQHDAHEQYGAFACQGGPAVAPSGVKVKHTGLENRDPWEVPRLTVMPLGDSITQGVGSSNDSLGYRKELWEALEGHTGKLDFVGSRKNGDGTFDGDHEGHPGWRIDELADNAGYSEGDLDRWLPAAKPNVITLMAGTNDLNRGAATSPQDARDRMDTLLGKIHAMAPDMTVLLGSIAPTDPDTKWARFQPLFTAYNKLLPPLVDTWRSKGMKIRFVNMSAVDAGDMKGGDGLHPTASGYTKLADAFCDSVAAAAADGWITENVEIKSAPSSTGHLGDGPVDINGDGKADYLVLEDNGAVKAWINKGTDAKGGGGWEEAGQIAAGVAPAERVRFADINGDGKADYLVLEDNGAVKAWINKGTDAKGGGGWEEAGQIAAGVAPAETVRFADINGDGKADYLVLEDNGAVKAWINNGGDGHGGWIDHGTFASGPDTPEQATRENVRFADVNGDGKADYLVVRSTGETWVWTNKGGDGHGGFEAPRKFASGPSTPVQATRENVRFADVNGDGKADYLVLAENGALTAWINNGGDSTQPGWRDPVKLAPAGSPGARSAVHTGINFNGGKDDCFVVDETGATEWIGCTTKSEKFITFQDHETNRVYFMDLNGDGYTDHLVVRDDGSVTARTHQGWNPPTSVSGKPTFRGWSSPTTYASGVGAPGDKVRLADIDGDGLLDYLVVEDDGSVRAHLNRGGDGKDGWSDRGTFASGAKPGSTIRFADINGDGKADYLSVADDGAVTAWINNGGDGKGGFTEYGTFASGPGGPGSGADVSFADINGDGKADYLLSQSDGSISAWVNNGGDSGGWIAADRIAAGTAPAHRVRI